MSRLFFSINHYLIFPEPIFPSFHYSIIPIGAKPLSSTLKTQNPDKSFIPADEKMICIDMKKIHLPDIVNALLNISPVIKVEEGIRVRAKRAVERMLKVPRD